MLRFYFCFCSSSPRAHLPLMLWVPFCCFQQARDRGDRWEGHLDGTPQTVKLIISCNQKPPTAGPKL